MRSMTMLVTLSKWLAISVQHFSWNSSTRTSWSSTISQQARLLHRFTCLNLHCQILSRRVLTAQCCLCTMRFKRKKSSKRKRQQRLKRQNAKLKYQVHKSRQKSLMSPERAQLWWVGTVSSLKERVSARKANPFKFSLDPAGKIHGLQPKATGCSTPQTRLGLSESPAISRSTQNKF